MIKLHRLTSSGHEYWETWNANGKIVIHTGIVGSIGQRSVFDLAAGENAESVMHQQARPIMALGFTPVNREEMESVVIHFKLSSWGGEEDLDKRHYIEDLITEALGWTGNGHCDGGEIGSGTMNIWCYVLDLGPAVTTISNELNSNGFSAGAVIAKYDEGSTSFRAIWPDTHIGHEIEV